MKSSHLAQYVPIRVATDVRCQKIIDRTLFISNSKIVTGLLWFCQEDRTYYLLKTSSWSFADSYFGFSDNGQSTFKRPSVYPFFFWMPGQKRGRETMRGRLSALSP